MFGEFGVQRPSGDPFTLALGHLGWDQEIKDPSI